MIDSKAKREMIDAAGRWCRRFGLARSTGQIYGLLYLSAEPLSLDDIVGQLGISKASASVGTRLLSRWGGVRQVWVPGDRRDFFEVVDDWDGLLRSVYKDYLKPRLEASQKQLQRLAHTLEREAATGALTPKEFKVCQERLRNLSRAQKRVQSLAPLLEKLL